MNNLQIYLVGGAVRDQLLNLPIKERDWVVVGATADTMLQQGFNQVGKDFPVFLHPETNEEYALARTERKTSKGYYGFECDVSETVSLEQDLLRRDLTINAIALAEDGTIIDPYNGQSDIKHKVLRHVSNAFVEDPVRLLRVARFLARFYHLGFSIAPETKQLLCDMVQSGEIDSLVPERVWKEFIRALAEQSPWQFIVTLKDCGALERIFPALSNLWGVPESPKWHPELYCHKHMELAMEQIVKLSNDPKLRFAVLTHDLGKGLTPKDQLPNHPGHDISGLPLLAGWCKQYRVPNQYRTFAGKVMRWHLVCHRSKQLAPEKVIEMFDDLGVWRDESILMDFITACEADARGIAAKVPDYGAKQYLLEAYAAAKTVTAKQFMDAGMKGAEIGKAIQQERISKVSEFKLREGS